MLPGAMSISEAPSYLREKDGNRRSTTRPLRHSRRFPRLPKKRIYFGISAVQPPRPS